MRKEKDSLGEVLVPDEKYYGAQTQRAYDNFKIGNERLPSEFIRAHALVKKAAARVNLALGSLDANLADAIQKSADEVIDGKLDDHFPLVILKERLAAWTAPPHKITKGVLFKYIKTVASASEGCVTDQ